MATIGQTTVTSMNTFRNVSEQGRNFSQILLDIDFLWKDRKSIETSKYETCQFRKIKYFLKQLQNETNAIFVFHKQNLNEKDKQRRAKKHPKMRP